VELFTSEGCSDCPPADRLLAHLQRTQPVAGADVIALEEHVDYWNSQGWVDPFSSAQFTERQTDYVHSFRLNSGPYTPQMVVEGSAQFVGSNERAALAAIAKAAENPEMPVTIEQIPDSNSDAGKVQLHVQVGPAASGQAGRRADVLLAITEDDLSSNVSAGENAGAHLEHYGVVRELRSIGHLDASGAFSTDTKVNLSHHRKRDNLRVVVFVQDHSSLAVLGASAIRLPLPVKQS
ncbi:MAG: DUF1223 domain-containing protein, partial [Candidatus Acidiferrales bacterium]